MTAANNLADYLSSILNNMKNSMSMKMGKGKKKGKGFSLPDLIKKQGELSDKMKNGLKKGKKPGDNKGKGKQGKSGQNGNNGKNGNKKKQGEGGFNNDLDGELYQIYKEQSLLRQQLQEAIKENSGSKPGENASAKKALKNNGAIRKRYS